jgi:hypothetical protein
MASNALRENVSNSAFQPRSEPALFPIITSGAMVQPQVGNWAPAVRARLNHLCQLSRGWDGYRGRAVSFETAHFAFQALSTIMSRGSNVAPQLVPGSDGDIQIEWHLPEQSIELHIKAPNVVSAWRESDCGEETLDLTNDFVSIVRWLAEPRRDNAAVVAANQ